MTRSTSLSIPCPSCEAAQGEPCVTSGGKEAHPHVARKRTAAKVHRVLRSHRAGGYPPVKMLRIPGDLAAQIVVSAAMAGMSQRAFVRAAIEHYTSHLESTV